MGRNFKWLIVVEGSTDVEIYRDLLVEYKVSKSDFEIFHVKGRSNVCDMSTWHERKHKNIDLKSFVEMQCFGMSSFIGLLLVVDSDTNANTAFNRYSRNNSFDYTTDTPLKQKNSSGYLELDYIIENEKIIPIRGIHVPHDNAGCLESDLLKSLDGRNNTSNEYKILEKIVISTSKRWNIPKRKDTKHWLDSINKKAKFDKFIYAAFSKGFEACIYGYKLKLPEEPKVITNIKKAIAYE